MSIDDTMFKLAEDIRTLQVQLNNAVSALGAIERILDTKIVINMSVDDQGIAAITKLERDLREGS